MYNFLINYYQMIQTESESFLAVCLVDYSCDLYYEMTLTCFLWPQEGDN